MNVPGATSEKILEKLDDIAKGKPDDLIIHVGTNNITNNVNLLLNVKKIFTKVSKKLSSTSIAFSLIISHKDKNNIKKNLTDTNAHLKKLYTQLGISFIENNGIKNFHLCKRKLHLNKSESSVFAKNLSQHINRTD